MQRDTEPTRPKAVLDSNVIISGIMYRQGNPSEVLRAFERGEIEVFISPFILEEVAEVLRRTFQQPDDTIIRVLGFLRIYSNLIDPPPESSLPELSTEDNRIIDCAVQGQVKLAGEESILLFRIPSRLGISNLP